MDAIIKQLRPASLKDQGLAPAISDLIQKWGTQNDIPVELNIRGERELALKVEQALYRITQEALNNISRHAEACQISIVLEYDTHEVCLGILDDGKGFDQAKTQTPQSLGLRSMRARTAEVGGELSVVSTIGSGTQIQVTVPINTP